MLLSSASNSMVPRRSNKLLHKKLKKQQNLLWKIEQWAWNAIDINYKVFSCEPICLFQLTNLTKERIYDELLLIIEWKIIGRSHSFSFSDKWNGFKVNKWSRLDLSFAVVDLVIVEKKIISWFSIFAKLFHQPQSKQWKIRHKTAAKTVSTFQWSLRSAETRQK